MSKKLSKQDFDIWMEALPGLEKDGLIKTATDGRHFINDEDGKAKFIPKAVWTRWEEFLAWELECCIATHKAVDPSGEEMDAHAKHAAAFFAQMEAEYADNTPKEETMTKELWPHGDLPEGCIMNWHVGEGELFPNREEVMTPHEFDFDEDHHVEVVPGELVTAIMVNGINTHSLLTPWVTNGDIAVAVNNYDTYMEENGLDPKLQTRKNNELPEEEAMNTKVRCSGKTREGQRCRRLGEPNHGDQFFCKNHPAPKEETMTTTVEVTEKGFKCGNWKLHGKGVVVHHATADDVAKCFGVVRQTHNRNVLVGDKTTTEFFGQNKAAAYAREQELRREDYNVIHVAKSTEGDKSWFVTYVTEKKS